MLTGDELLAKVKEIAIEQSTKPLSKDQSIGRIHREMTEPTLCKETIKFLIESLKEDPEYTKHPYGEYDRGYKSGIGYGIWKLTQFLK